jgi:hypothetical protein
MSPAVREEILHFGATPRLFGISTTVPSSRRSTGLVLANSGIVHRVGANRITVVLARRLAALGYESLRFDLSGLGDAPDRGDHLSWEKAAPQEIGTAVVAVCDRPGVRQAVLYGNCGGAAKSFWAAEGDLRVAGLLLTNPPPHPADHEFGKDVETYSHGRLVPADLPLDLGPRIARVLDRGLRALFLYAAGDVGEAFFWKRLAPDLRLHLDTGRLRIGRVRATNHTFASHRSREEMLEAAAQWLLETFPEVAVSRN